ncbi:RsmB/NOP family class I SAM-dependent RNA methyltransferase, partial [Rhodosalinus sp.]|uniref:RsmB/NOP family class I SAM-dependent RNA methyltransferase n=1 Tax=Rhodosalinus sp. TaxID=2047741 RepID=UPI003561639A
LRARGEDPEAVFTGARHAPAPLSEADRAAGRAPEGAEALDLPDWLAEAFRDSLGPQAEAAALALRERAPVHLRANLLKTDREGAAEALAAEGIATRPVATAATALEVTEGARRVARSRAFAAGLVELQDAASQAVVAALPLAPGARVLDFCAGGGGKTLALAARLGGPVAAHDAAPRRLADLPARAARAGAGVEVLARPDAAAPFDLVLCDVPCSGSGAWRRDPDAKWRLTPARLAELGATQDAILDRVAPLVAPGGTLAYATCSLLAEENDARTAAFRARRPGWQVAEVRRWRPGPCGDGFYLCVLTRA